MKTYEIRVVYGAGSLEEKITICRDMEHAREVVAELDASACEIQHREVGPWVQVPTLRASLYR